MSDKVKRIYRLPPCADYDVEGMENWLTHMAAEGYVLAEDGFFAGVATFEVPSPQHLKYRLEAAKKNTSMWADDGGEPDPEAVELSEQFGWKYVSKRGRFYIYCSDDPSARELNTDPRVQALALDYVRKSQKQHIISIVLYMLVYPLIGFRGALLLFTVNIGSWLVLFWLLSTVWGMIYSVSGLRHLNRMKRSLLQKGCISSGTDWKENKVKYFVAEICRMTLIVVWITVIIFALNKEVSKKDHIPLADFEGDMPFATIADFAPEGEYELENWGFSNTVHIWSDLISPYSADWNELADVDLPDGTSLEGGLYVDYNEFHFDWMAAWAAREYWLLDSKKREEALELPELDADYAVGYSDGIFPTIVVQKGNKVIHAYFYQTSSNYRLSPDQWVTILADSIG